MSVAVGEGKGSGRWTDRISCGCSARKLVRPKVGADRAALQLDVGRLGTVGTAKAGGCVGNRMREFTGSPFEVGPDSFQRFILGERHRSGFRRRGHSARVKPK